MQRVLLATTLAGVLGVSALTVLAQNERKESSETAVDPVCNIAVRKDPKLSAEYEGQTYYFCMKADLAAFQKDPGKYINGESSHRHPD